MDPMADLHGVLDPYVTEGEVAGAVALIAQQDRVDVGIAGNVDLEGSAPMARDTLFRIASITKPITSAAAMVLVEDGRMGLDDPVASWLPEIASPQVVRTPASPLDDVVPAVRPITVRHLLASRAGWGFPDDFSLPAIQPLLTELGQGPMPVDLSPEAWMARLALVPLLHQPGDGWLYNTSYDILGVLIARVSGRPLPEFMAERLFEPLGMADTGFSLPSGARDRLAAYYRHSEAGPLEQVAAAGEYSGSAFPSGAGGLLSTVDDWHSFARMLLAGGEVTGEGHRVLSPESVRLMTTDQLTAVERARAAMFLEGQGWGYGGSVDVAAIDEWNTPNRYGWVGGTGTAAHVSPATGTVTVLMTQTEMAGPTPPPVMRDFWRYAVRWSQPGSVPAS
jgi:CubicO group peptidase (beta-lactamase class C family)